MSIPRPLYHYAPIRLGDGSIILPGNYGRLVHAAGSGGPHWFRECLLERTRQQYFPQKPSRLNCCYVWINLAHARFMQNRGINDILYEVEPVNPNAAWHLGDPHALPPIPGRQDSSEDQAYKYWTGSLTIEISDRPDLSGMKEILISSELRIIRCLDAPPASGGPASADNESG